LSPAICSGSNYVDTAPEDALVFLTLAHPFAHTSDTADVLQHFLGHASITNTVRYTAMSPEPFKDIWR
jgi:site-specific recombinase XerD